MKKTKKPKKKHVYRIYLTDAENDYLTKNAETKKLCNRQYIIYLLTNQIYV